PGTALRTGRNHPYALCWSELTRKCAPFRDRTRFFRFCRSELAREQQLRPSPSPLWGEGWGEEKGSHAGERNDLRKRRVEKRRNQPRNQQRRRTTPSPPAGEGRGEGAKDRPERSAPG